MKTAILRLIAASALGCAAVNDGRLETAVNAAEPITLVSGEEHAPVRGTIGTPEGVCKWQADVLLLPELYSVSCGEYTFSHSEFEEGRVYNEEGRRVYPYGERMGTRFSYTLSSETWNWNATCSSSLSRRVPIQNEPRGAILENRFSEEDCNGQLESFGSSVLVPYENQPWRYHIDTSSPLTFTVLREPRAPDGYRNYVVGTEEEFEQKTQEYNSLQQQMNVEEADRLWRKWRHTALGYAE